MLLTARKALRSLTTSILRCKSDSLSSNKGASSQQMKIIRQKAYLAHEMIDMIEKPRQSVMEIPLRYQLLDFINNHDNSQESSKKALRQLFDEGIVLQPYIYPQARIQDAKNKNKKISFYPTNFVAGDIFESYRTNQSYQMLYGHFGISKTFTTILYQKLNDFIVDYRMRLTDPAQIASNVLRCSKIIYWSINMKKDTMKKVNDLIKSQLLPIELEFLEKKKYEFNGQNQYSLEQLYIQKGIQIHIKIDNINAAIAEVRKHNYNTGEIDEEKQKLPEYKKIKEIEQIISKMIQEFYKITYLCSVNVEKSQFHQIKLKPKEVNSVAEIELPFNEYLEKEETKSELIDYFIYLFEQNFEKKVKQLRNKSGLEKKQFHKDIHSHLLKSLKNTSSFYLNHLAIRLQIHNRVIKQKFKVLNIKDVNQLKQYMQSTFQYILYIGMPQLLGQKVKQFMTNNEHLKVKKELFILEIFQQFERNEAAGLPKDTPLKIKKSNFQIMDTSHMSQIQSVLDRHLFKCQNDQIELLIPADLFFNLKLDRANTTLLQHTADILLNIQASTLKKYVRDGQAMGKTIQNIIILGLTRGSSSMRFLNFKKEQIKSFSNINSNVCTFNAILPKNQPQYSLSKSIQTGVRSMINQLNSKDGNKQLRRLFLPIGGRAINLEPAEAEEILNSANPSSMHIDFMMVTYHKDKEFVVDAFDVTIDSKVKVIKEKISKFLQSYQLFKSQNQPVIKIDNKTYGLKLNYYVISPHPESLQLSNAVVEAIQENKGLQLTKATDKNVFESKDQQQLVNQVGHFSLDGDIKVQNPNIKGTIEFKMIESLVEHLKRK